MKIIVDADACPGKALIIQTARAHHLKVLLVADTNHQLMDDYAEILQVDPGKDAADIALINRINPGDVVITQDYGVASMALARGAFSMHPKGFCYTKENIDQLMFERFLGQKARRGGMRTKGPKPRRSEDDLQLQRCLEGLLLRNSEVDSQSGAG